MLMLWWPQREWLFGYSSLEIAAVTAATISGSTYVLLAIWVHEEHGTLNFAKIYGSLLSFGVLGIALFEKYLFIYIYRTYNSTEEDKYGKWNTILFQVSTGAAILALCLAWIGYCFEKRNEKAELKVERIELRIMDHLKDII